MKKKYKNSKYVVVLSSATIAILSLLTSCGDKDKSNRNTSSQSGSRTIDSSNPNYVGRQVSIRQNKPNFKTLEVDNNAISCMRDLSDDCPYLNASELKKMLEEMTGENISSGEGACKARSMIDSYRGNALSKNMKFVASNVLKPENTRVRGVIEEVQENRYKIRITSMAKATCLGVIGSKDLSEYGYPNISEGSTVWTSLAPWNLD